MTSSNLIRKDQAIVNNDMAGYLEAKARKKEYQRQRDFESRINKLEEKTDEILSILRRLSDR